MYTAAIEGIYDLRRVGLVRLALIVVSGRVLRTLDALLLAMLVRLVHCALLAYAVLLFRRPYNPSALQLLASNTAEQEKPPVCRCIVATRTRSAAVLRPYKPGVLQAHTCT